MPWDFKPVQHEMTLKIGETGLAFFEAHNPTNRVVAGTASFNVFPYSAGAYFDKLACFCFELQVLQPGETIQMPVSFFVDPAIVDDPEGKYVSEITLSYTFHETALPEDQAALAPAQAGAVN
jgi:cytochrome c oxidase assembly protein subunit 11